MGTSIILLLAWLACGWAEIVADHNWERHRNPRWWLQPWRNPCFHDRHAVEAFLMALSSLPRQAALSSNYSILQENTLLGLSESAGVLYLTLTDKFQGDERRAFLVACVYEERAAGVLDHIIMHMLTDPDLDYGRLATVPPDVVYRQLSEFFAARWQHNFMKEE